MKTSFRCLIALGFLLCLASVLGAQSLSPRAYVITPVGSNAVTVSWDIDTGAIQFNNTAPIAGASGTINAFLPTYYHALSLCGRSANVLVGLPYAVGTFQGLVVGREESVYRSGLDDGFLRFSVNLKGGPAMKTPQFAKWKQKTLLGVSLFVQAPTGQYDPTKLINIGTNRWAFKPEFGYSQSWGHWVLDAYAAVWFFTTNPEYFSHNPIFPGTNVQTQAPLGAFEGHLSYDFKPRLWASLDGNFYFGGETRFNGVPSPTTRQQNSRVGITVSIPFSRHQAVKVAYSNGAYVRFGGDFQAVSVGWQYSWIGKHFR